MLQKYGPLCIALVTLGTGCWNALGAIGRLFPSLEILTFLFVVMSIPLVLTFFSARGCCLQRRIQRTVVHSCYGEFARWHLFAHFSDGRQCSRLFARAACSVVHSYSYASGSRSKAQGDTIAQQSHLTTLKAVLGRVNALQFSLNSLAKLRNYRLCVPWTKMPQT